MPWLAIPFKDRDIKNKLSKKFKVQGIPMFVILDKDGSVITTDGRTKVMGDMSGENFPWRPKPINELLEGGFVNNKGEKFPVSCLDGKNVGFYFSAHWCPPCRGFTPSLAEMYNKLKAAGKPFEIIFVSSDRDKSGFDEYMADMPWLALPFENREVKEELASKFEVSGIPQLTICDDTAGRKVINLNARSAVSADPEGAKFPWVPPPLKMLPDGADCINEETCLVALLDGCDDDDQDDAVAALDAVAAEFKAAGDEIVFMCTKGGDPVSPQIRKLTKIKPKPSAQLLILDIPDEGGYHEPNDKITTVTAEVVKKFIADYKAKSTTRKQLGK
jgi:nucleoredoxin